VSLIEQKRFVPGPYDIYLGSRAIDPKLRKMARQAEVIMTSKNLWIRLALSTALVGGSIFAFGTPSLADADHRAECQQRLESDRARIDSDVIRYGDSIRQVVRDIAKMDKSRQWCRNHKADWDHDRFDLTFYLTGKR
jgi:hypothetical protein